MSTAPVARGPAARCADAVPLLQRALRSCRAEQVSLLAADDGCALAAMPPTPVTAEVNAATLRRLGMPSPRRANRLQVGWGSDAMQVAVGARCFGIRPGGSGLEDGGALHPAARHWMQRALEPTLAEGERLRARVQGHVDLVAGAAVQVAARSRQAVAIASHPDTARRPWAHTHRDPGLGRPLLVSRGGGALPLTPDTVTRCVPPACRHMFPLLSPSSLLQDVEQLTGWVARVAREGDAAAEGAWRVVQQWDDQVDVCTRALDTASAAVMVDDDSSDVVALLSRTWWKPFAHALTPLALAPWVAGGAGGSAAADETSALLDADALVPLDPTTASASSYYGAGAATATAVPAALPPGASFAAAWPAGGVIAAPAPATAPYW